MKEQCCVFRTREAFRNLAYLTSGMLDDRACAHSQWRAACRHLSAAVIISGGLQAVGGDLHRPAASELTGAFSRDGSTTWVASTGLTGYRSSVAFVKKNPQPGLANVRRTVAKHGSAPEPKERSVKVLDFYFRLPSKGTEMAEILKPILLVEGNPNDLELPLVSFETRDKHVICVADNGLGFDQVYIQQIFGLFKRPRKDDTPVPN